MRQLVPGLLLAAAMFTVVSVVSVCARGLGVRHYSRCARAECRRTTELGGSWGRAAAGHKPDHRKYPPDTAHTKMEPGPFYM